MDLVKIANIAKKCNFNWFKKNASGWVVEHHQGKITSYNTIYDLEKFAELIIKECIDIFNDKEFNNPNCLCVNIQERIKQHFEITNE